jgi:vanillate O-demethylase monooxygenase subunit
MFAADHPLRHYWHPVARAAEVGDKPKAAKLLGTDIVLWRTETGVSAFKDLCIHRGTRLSLGWIKDNELVCPYHGWCFGADGAVTTIPAIPKDRPIPARARRGLSLRGALRADFRVHGRAAPPALRCLRAYRA